MSRYRRANSAGATYFFTVVAYRRQTILCDEPIRTALRNAIAEVRTRRPFAIMPGRCYRITCVASGRCRLKMPISPHVGHYWAWERGLPARKNAAKMAALQSTLWQRRYWEHRVRTETDFARHVDYIPTILSSMAYAARRKLGRIPRFIGT